MNIIFSKIAWESYQYWQNHDKTVIKRINMLIKEIHRDPFAGPGKPEALKHQLEGYWSRRINAEHRIIYRVIDGHLFIYSLRYHYKK